MSKVQCPRFRCSGFCPLPHPHTPTRIAACLTALWLATQPALADSVTLTALRDATIHSDPGPALANGSGDFFFAGMIGENSDFALRRALLSFDVDSVIPSGSIVTSATLRISVSRDPSGGPATANFDLHRALADWGEGPSDPGGQEGSGTAALTGDATWDHAFHSNIAWSTTGGDFAATVSASTTIGGIGAYSFSSAGMVTDVQTWLDNPAQDYGWFLLGDESLPKSARRFNSKDLGDSDTWPSLEVGYVVPEPTTILLVLTGITFGILTQRRKERVGGNVRQYSLSLGRGPG